MAQHQIEIYSVDYDDNPIYKANVVVCNRDDFADLMWHLDQIKGLTEGFRASTIIDVAQIAKDHEIPYSTVWKYRKQYFNSQQKIQADYKPREPKEMIKLLENRI